MKVGFIGAGRMTYALCKGFLKSSLVRPSEITASDPNRTKLREIKRDLGIKTAENNADIVNKNKVVFLSVKPNTIKDILTEVTDKFNIENALLVSIAAGVTTQTIENFLPERARVIRVMPNTPCLVQSGVCVFTRGKYAEEGDADLVTEMLNCVGLVEEMPETLMDTVTGLSGSGPAYAFVTIEALADGGVKMGLNREQALRLSAQTLMGAAKLVLESGKHPEVLKDDVCSPGGTSIHALHQLERGQFRATLINAVEAGTLRSKELGEPI